MSQIWLKFSGWTQNRGVSLSDGYVGWWLGLGWCTSWRRRSTERPPSTWSGRRLIRSKCLRFDLNSVGGLKIGGVSLNDGYVGWRSGLGWTQSTDSVNRMTTRLKLMLAFIFQENIPALNGLRPLIEGIGLSGLNDYLDSINTLPKLESSLPLTDSALSGI